MSLGGRGRSRPPPNEGDAPRSTPLTVVPVTIPAMRWMHRFRFLSAASLATDVLALWHLVRHPATPRLPKLVALLVLAYALSPIDLIPDFIPVLGQLDDLVLVPLGLALVVRLVPAAHWAAMRELARAQARRLPRMVLGAVLVVMVWLLLLAALGVWAWRTWGAA